MIPFIIILIATILSMMYVDRLVKIKFRYEKNSRWKIIHIITFMPLLGVAFLVTDGNLIYIGILLITMFLC
jgi:hypothetical protein